MANEILQAKDQIIAFMGPTGAGKSTLIDALTQSTNWSGDKLKSHTSEVRHVKINHPKTGENSLVFVDTPGFDDTYKSDMEILEMIGDWLKTTYEGGVPLAGIVYVHRITDNRMAGTPHRNLRMFGELCGEKAAEKVTLVTTMWDKMKTSDLRATGEKREGELRDKFWKEMVMRGAHVSRFDNTQEAAWKIVNDILARNHPQAVLLQEELVDFHRRLNETQAGRALYSQLQKLLAQQKETIRLLADQAREKQNTKLARDLDAEYKRIQAEFEKTFEQVAALKISFGRRITLFFSKRLPTRALKIAD